MQACPPDVHVLDPHVHHCRQLRTPPLRPEGVRQGNDVSLRKQLTRGLIGAFFLFLLSCKSADDR